MTAKTDVLVKLALVFFISLLSFSIGTYVGKKYSDNQHKLAALEPQHGATEGGRQVASIVDSNGTVESTMSDDEIAKIAEEFADDDTVIPTRSTASVEDDEHHEAAAVPKTANLVDAHAPTKTVDSHGAAAAAKKEIATAPAAAVHHDVAHAAPVAAPNKAVAVKAPTPAPTHAAKNELHEEASAPAKNLSTGHEPAPTPTKKVVESRVPSSLPKDVAQYSVGKFTVQIASFRTEEEAKTRAAGLKGQGYSAFYVPAKVKGDTWYRVSVGLFATEQEAKDYKETFGTKAKISDTIVQKLMQ